MAKKLILKQIPLFLLSLITLITSSNPLISRCNHPQCYIQTVTPEGMEMETEKCRQKHPKAFIKVDGVFYKRFYKDIPKDPEKAKNYFKANNACFVKLKDRALELRDENFEYIDGYYYLKDHLEEYWVKIKRGPEKGKYRCKRKVCRHLMSNHSLHYNEFKYLPDGRRASCLTQVIDMKPSTKEAAEKARAEAEAKNKKLKEELEKLKKKNTAAPAA